MDGYSTINTITTNGTIWNMLGGIGGLVCIVTMCLIGYKAYKYFFTITEESMKTRKDDNYLHGVYTAFKAGVVFKQAEKEGIEMIFRPDEEPENEVIKGLKDDVKEGLSK
jgi:hypothetical protein